MQIESVYPTSNFKVKQMSHSKFWRRVNKAPALLGIKTDLMLLLTVAVVAVSVYLFFKTIFGLQLGTWIPEIMAAMLGAILTVMITMVLIRQQGTVQRAQEAAAVNMTKIFEKKLELFREFLLLYSKAAEDGKIDRKELIAMRQLALTISLFTKPVAIDAGTPTASDAKKPAPIKKDLGEELCRYVLQLHTYRKFYFEMTEEDKDGAKKKLGGEAQSIADILRLMKAELNVAQLSGEDDVEQQVWTAKLMNFDFNKQANEKNRVNDGESIEAATKLTV
ncbi:MAG: hypothetical protein OXU98_03180 [Gammaproteobacteria bacterium]|nr:hypothetical protein [Gammaproteobacteria bacterium]